MTFKKLPTSATVLMPLACEGSIAIRVDYKPDNVISTSEMDRDNVASILNEAMRCVIEEVDELNREIEKTMMRDGLSPDVNFCTCYGTEKKVRISTTYVKIDVTILIPRLNVGIKLLLDLAEDVLDYLVTDVWNVLDPEGCQAAQSAYVLAMARDGDEEAEPLIPPHRTFQPATDDRDDQCAN